MIELESQNHRGDPEAEAKAWLDKLSDVDRERRGYLRLAAKGLMNDEDLDEELAALEETRKTAERELEACRGKAERISEMERDRDAVLASYAGAAPEVLDALTAEERRHVYGMLKVRAVAMPDRRIVVSGAFVGGPLTEPLRAPEVCITEPLSWRCTSRCSRYSS